MLAVTLPADVDLDNDGYPDADDDADGLIDEDLPNDIHHDFFPGIMLIDDDGDGSVDEGTGWAEDDEDGAENEDPLDGIDNDGAATLGYDARRWQTRLPGKSSLSTARRSCSGRSSPFAG